MAKSKKARKSGGARRRVHRNPPKSFGAFAKPISESVWGALLAIGGMWGASFLGKYVGDMLPTISEDPNTQKALGQAAVAAGATTLAAFVLPPRFVVPVGIGAFIAPGITVVKMANISVINDNLSDYARRRFAGYAQPRALPGATFSDYARATDAAGMPATAFQG